MAEIHAAPVLQRDLVVLGCHIRIFVMFHQHLNLLKCLDET